jgi:hypothetical protein
MLKESEKSCKIFRSSLHHMRCCTRMINVYYHYVQSFQFFIIIASKKRVRHTIWHTEQQDNSIQEILKKLRETTTKFMYTWTMLVIPRWQTSEKQHKCQYNTRKQTYTFTDGYAYFSMRIFGTHNKHGKKSLMHVQSSIYQKTQWWFIFLCAC